MAKYLVFHLMGPMAAFGDIAVGEYRPTYAHPGKSTILGLIASALGIRRNEEERLQILNENLGTAVLILSAGSLLRDYHTTQVPSSVSVKRQPVSSRKDELSHKDLITILSARDYRMDAIYRIAVWSKSDKVDLKTIQQAFEHPKFSLYLGRKSCPLAIPLNAELVQADSADKALLKQKLDLEVDFFVLKIISQKNQSSHTMLLYQEKEDGVETETMQKNWRKDRLISRKAWQYGDREEFMMTLEEKDVF